MVCEAEWTAFEQPDPNNLQLQALQRVLRMLANGQHDVQNDPMIPMMGQAGGPGSERITKALTMAMQVRGEAWRAALPSMYAWIDWACVPQPNAALWKPMSMRHALPQGTGKEDASSAPPKAAESDHRAKAGMSESVLSDLRRAVRSLPAYVELSEFLLVLAPPVAHADVRGRVCNLRTWFSRGWTRLEICSAFLARRPLPVLVISSHATDPPVPLDGGVGATAARRLLAARGRFTVEADRAVVAEVQLALLEAASARCRAQKELVELFLVEAVIETLSQFRPLPRVGEAPGGGEASGGVTDGGADVVKDGAAALRERVAWDQERMAEYGINLLMVAAFLGDVHALTGLLGTATSEQINQTATKGVPGTLVAPGMTPLILANLSASSGGPQCVTALLEAGADPKIPLFDNPFIRISAFASPFPLPAGVQAEGTLDAWLKRSPDDAHQTMKLPLGAPTSVLAVAALKGNLAQVRTLLRHGARPSDTDLVRAGAPYTFLHQMLQGDLFYSFRATCVDAETLEAVLTAYGPEQLDARSRVPPEVRRLHADACRTYGRRLPPLVRAAEVSGLPGHPQGGLTALHQAILLGEPELCTALLAAGAPASTRTRGRWWRRGRTPLELARAEFGAQGHNPALGVLELIEEVLNADGKKGKGKRKGNGKGKARTTGSTLAKDKVLPRGGYSGVVVPPAEGAP